MSRFHRSTQEKISRFNTFKVFEKLYGHSGTDSLEEFEQPVDKPNTLFKQLVALLVILLVALTLHPLLSYFFKTPYPLVTVTDNNLSPLLKQGDVILSKGIITPQQIKPGDLVVFYYLVDNQKVFSIRQVKTINRTQFVLTDLKRKELLQSVDNKYIVGQVIGGQRPWRLPLIGTLTLFWAKIK